MIVPGFGVGLRQTRDGSDGFPRLGSERLRPAGLLGIEPTATLAGGEPAGVGGEVAVAALLGSVGLVGRLAGVVRRDASRAPVGPSASPAVAPGCRGGGGDATETIRPCARLCCVVVLRGPTTSVGAGFALLP